MGLFSWNTMDTNKSIASTFSNRDTFRVYMMDNAGNIWTENDYEGYGVFGGKDFYELLAEMNGFVSELKGDEYNNAARLFAIDLVFANNNHSGDFAEGVFYPNLTEKVEGWVYDMKGPERCEHQGYFYDDDEDEDDEYNEEEYAEEEENY
jgi:hypothetical protein